MGFTYSGNPTGSSLDALRFEIGDTNADLAKFQDEELLYLLTNTGNDVLWAAVFALENLARKYSQLADVSVGRTHIARSAQARQLMEQAKQLRSRVNGNAIPSSASAFVSEKEELQDDSNLVPPYFRRDMFNNNTFP